MKYLKLYEQFDDEEEPWWEKETPFDDKHLPNSMKIVSLGSTCYIAEIINEMTIKLYNDDVHVYSKNLPSDMNPQYDNETSIFVFKDRHGYFIKFKDLPKEIKDRIV